MQDYIYGLMPVVEALRSKRRAIRRILIATSSQPARLTEVCDLARRENIPIEKRDRRDLDTITRRANHQGIVALLATTAHLQYSSPETILDSLGELPLVVLLDNIEDTHNFGAILRTCDGAGVNGVFVPQHRSAPLNETVAKTSAGAVEYVSIAQVVNLVSLINELKERGLWIVGIEGDTQKAYTDFDFKIPLALIFGSEGKGIRRLVRENCDAVVSIPMHGKLNSLNVSVATGVVLFEVLRQRR